MPCISVVYVLLQLKIIFWCLKDQGRNIFSHFIWPKICISAVTLICCLCMHWLNFPKPDLDLVAKKQSAVATVPGVIGLASHLKFISFLSMLFSALTLLFVFLHVPSWKTCSLALGAGTADFGSGRATPCTKLCKAVCWSCDYRNERGACVLAGLVCGMCGCIDLHVHMRLIYL